jgi:ArsR family transcriptional regulator
MATLKQQAQTLKLLGNPARLRILFALAAGRCNVSTICRKVALPQATVSQHLAALRRRRIVTAERRGVQVCYSLTDPGAARILAALHEPRRSRRKK